MSAAELPVSFEHEPQAEGLIQDPFVQGLEAEMIQIVDEVGVDQAVKFYNERFNNFSYNHAENPAFSDQIEAAFRYRQYWMASEGHELADASALYALFELSCHNPEFEAQFKGNSIWHRIADVSERLRIGDDQQQNFEFLTENDELPKLIPWQDSEFVYQNGSVVPYVELSDGWAVAKETRNRLAHIAMFGGLIDYHDHMSQLARDKKVREDRWLLFKLREAAGIPLVIEPQPTKRERFEEAISTARLAYDALFTYMVEADRPKNIKARGEDSE
ncbi:MAG: hypothetical protein HKN32_08840 [Flavobacteriales bacterium]|nr:hypothetical protein [Flavobacteriales bacterium]